MGLTTKLTNTPTTYGVMILHRLFETRDQIHYWHLQTTSYAEHKALNQFYDELLDLADSFIETYQGEYGRIKGKIGINIIDYSTPENTVNYLQSFQEFLEQGARKINDTDLNNQLDEMLSLTKQTLYLLTLK